MPASSKRPAVKTAGIKLAIALATVGGSLGGWAAMGLQQQGTAADTAAQVALVVPTSAATATATSAQVAAIDPTATATTAATSAATTATVSTTTEPTATATATTEPTATATAEPTATTTTQAAAVPQARTRSSR